LIGIATLFVAYFSLSSFGILPPLYFGSMPSGYSKVVKQSEANKDPRQTRAFEEAYRKFINGK
jgi:hypothetical protein